MQATATAKLAPTALSRPAPEIGELVVVLGRAPSDLVLISASIAPIAELVGVTRAVGVPVMAGKSGTPVSVKIPVGEKVLLSA